MALIQSDCCAYERELHTQAHRDCEDRSRLFTESPAKEIQGLTVATSRCKRVKEVILPYRFQKEFSPADTLIWDV